MRKNEYIKCAFDCYVYYKKTLENCIYLLLYVDDMLIVAISMEDINYLKSQFVDEFDMKDLGEANFILGMKITKTSDGIFLDQQHYIEKILNKYKFIDCKHVATPVDANLHLFPVKSEIDVINQKEYASMIGSLRYVTDYTRPGIACAVGVLSRFTSN